MRGIKGDVDRWCRFAQPPGVRGRSVHTNKVAKGPALSLEFNVRGRSVNVRGRTVHTNKGARILRLRSIGLVNGGHRAVAVRALSAWPRRLRLLSCTRRRAFRSPCLLAEEYVLPRMTANPQSSPPGPGPFRFPETIRRCVSGHRKRSSTPTVRRPEPASLADLLPPRGSRRPAASPANLRPSSARQRPEPLPGVANFDSVRFIASPIPYPVCSKARTSIFPCRRTILLITKYMADANLR